MWRICHKQLLMVKIYSVGMISNMSGVKYEKLFSKIPPHPPHPPHL